MKRFVFRGGFSQVARAASQQWTGADSPPAACFSLAPFRWSPRRESLSIRRSCALYGVALGLPSALSGISDDGNHLAAAACDRGCRVASIIRRVNLIWPDVGWAQSHALSPPAGGPTSGGKRTIHSQRQRRRPWYGTRPQRFIIKHRICAGTSGDESAEQTRPNLNLSFCASSHLTSLSACWVKHLLRQLPSYYGCLLYSGSASLCPVSWTVFVALVVFVNFPSESGTALARPSFDQQG